MGPLVSRSFLLQDWTTVRSSLATALVQDPDAWLDLDGYSDVSCWVDIAEVTPPRGGYVQLQLETAPSADDAYFVPIGPPLQIGTSAPFVQPSTTPTLVRSAKSATTNNLMRYLRWNLQASALATWDVTVRIHAIAARSPTFVPALLPGCAVWFRADLGVTLAGTAVTSWGDQSGTGDSNKNLAATGSPTYVVADTNYMNQPTMSFSGSSQYFTSGTWTTALVQENTWVIVGHRANVAAQMDAMDGATSGYGQLVAGAGSNAVIAYAGTSVVTPTNTAYSWLSPSAVLVEFNGGSTNIFVNNFSSSAATGPAGAANFRALCVGSHNPAFTPGNYWNGTIAEIIAYSGALSATSKAQLRNYLNGRYGIAIG